MLNLASVDGAVRVEGGVAGGMPAATALYKDTLRSLLHQSKLRNLTGQDWEQRIDSRTGIEFYFNTDTQQSSWDKPLSLHVSVASPNARTVFMKFGRVKTSILYRTVLAICGRLPHAGPPYTLPGV